MLRADSLFSGLAVMLVMTVLQRAIGLFRGVAFCRLLDAERLGQWAMAFGFIALVTPMLLLGIPGSLPRYVEAFRRQGQLRPFLFRIVGLTGLLISTAVTVIWLFPQPVAWLVFRAPSEPSLVRAVGAAVLAFVIFNTLNELISSLRQVRVVSLMQFLQSTSFTLIGVLWLSRGGGLVGLIFGFAAATLLGSLPGWWLLLRYRQTTLPASETALDTGKMWRRVLPYAAALWMMNVLSNTFQLSDRYMMLHFGGGEPASGQAMVGQYHTACIIPGLLLSLGLMIGGILMPYLTADWEAGRKQAVTDRLRQMLLGVAILFTLGATVALALAPTLFAWVFSGRYLAALAVLPLAFVFSIWLALSQIAQNYLWVVERGKLVGIAVAVGLVTNLFCNATLMPRFGLFGAVLATLIAHGVAFAGIWWAMHRTGFPLDRTCLWTSLLPFTLLGGPLIALVAVLACLATSQQARDWLRVALAEVEARLPGRRLRHP